MAFADIKPWEPEESVGTLWHRFITKVDARPSFPQAAVALEAMKPRIGVLFRALGGAAGAEIAEAAGEMSHHRLSWLRKLGTPEETVARAAYDGETLALPAAIDLYPETPDNEALFIWLAASAAFAVEPAGDMRDCLRRDVAALRAAIVTVGRTLDACPGLLPVHERLAAATLAVRRRPKRPQMEADLEAAVRALLGDRSPLSETAELFRAAIRGEAPLDALPFAPDGYCPVEPVPLWLDRRKAASPEAAGERDDAASASSAQKAGMRKKAKRRDSSEINKRDSLILNRFETILSWTQFMNINRRVEDDDVETARKAAEDQQELGLGDIDQRPATKLAFDLDLAPKDVDRVALSGEHLVPEWDYRAGQYRKDACRILVSDADPGESAVIVDDDPARRRRIAAVRRRFEALRPKRSILPRQVDGDELDMDQVVRSLVDIRASGEGSDRIFKRVVNAERDLAIATLIDVSRSTEAIVEERSVIDVAREALTAFGHGLQQTGDDHAIYAFSSLRRDKVFVNRCKAFGEAMGPAVERRIAALKPGFYTRLGAAVRHVSEELATRAASRRLLLVITDGKPNDIDHYEGRFGVEDTRKAVIEARRQGHAVFAVAIEAGSQAYLPYLFGRNGYALVPRPERLAEALPLIYRQLVTE